MWSSQLDDFAPWSVADGHAVSIVGHTPDYLIVRNSWGTWWGDSGYVLISDDYVKRAFTEAWGVIV